MDTASGAGALRTVPRFGYNPPMSSDPAGEAGLASQTIPVNMYQAPHAVVVVAVAPAVTPDDVVVERTGRHLSIRARLRNAAEREYLLHEWTYGAYERQLDLPDGFGGGVEASLVNGQLVVRILEGPVEPGETVSVTPAKRHTRS
ncbi:MAG: Hsp20/alpha crystallin family protein [Actinomycetota bacterium]|nr:Hsp20/alpha crystallin family protein [Actinomycetota bacterium]